VDRSELNQDSAPVLATEDFRIVSFRQSIMTQFVDLFFINKVNNTKVDLITCNCEVHT
jgi:hypothetical protein